VKTIKLGEEVKNGSIIANIAIGEKEIARFKNRHFKKGDEGYVGSDNIFLPEDNQLPDVEHDPDLYSGAVVYDRYNQAVTPFSRGEDDIMNSPEKFDLLDKKDSESMQNSDNAPMDRFAQMRANIKQSIKNAPQIQKSSSISNEELLKISNKDMEQADNGNLFSTNNNDGVSKFRQIVQARKEQLLKDEDYQEAKQVDESINAMSKTDEKGRPLIMRNIIAARMEKINQSGGDVSVLKNDSVATKENSILDKDKIVVATRSDNSHYSGARMSESSSSYSIIDENELSGTHTQVLPDKLPDELLDEIKHKQKSTRTYAEAKLSNLYDVNRR
jgi:hypothetical protein